MVRIIFKILRNCVFIAIGIFILLLFVILSSPILRSSVYRWSYAQVHTFIFTLQKRALKSEIESGIFGRIIEDTVGYDDSLAPTNMITKGTKIMAVDLKGRPRSINSERVLSVMLPNQFGDFVKGKIVLVPSKNVDWKSHNAP